MALKLIDLYEQIEHQCETQAKQAQGMEKGRLVNGAKMAYALRQMTQCKQNTRGAGLELVKRLGYEDMIDQIKQAII